MVGRGDGRARLRPSRGFPRYLALRCHPPLYAGLGSMLKQEGSRHSRGEPGMPRLGAEPRPTIGFAHVIVLVLVIVLSLTVAGDKSWIGISSFWHTPPRPLRRAFFSLPRVEWYARRHAGFEHLPGHQIAIEIRPSGD